MNRQLFLRHVAQTSSTPLMLEIVKTDGCWMFDANGKKYLDMISGIAVSNVGHNNQDVKVAITNQLDKYSHLMVYGEFVESPQVQFATWIAAHMPAPLDSVYFVNSGSEAIEGALKLAKRVTGRPEIISFFQSQTIKPSLTRIFISALTTFPKILSTGFFVQVSISPFFGSSIEKYRNPGKFSTTGKSIVFLHLS